MTPDFVIIDHANGPSRPDPSLATNDLERACFVGNNTNPNVAQAFRKAIKKSIRDLDSTYTYSQPPSVEKIISPISVESRDSMEKVDQDDLAEAQTVKLLSGMQHTASNLYREASENHLLARVLLGAEGSILDTLCDLAFDAASLGAEFMLTNRCRTKDPMSTILVGRGSLAAFPHFEGNLIADSFVPAGGGRGIGLGLGSLEDQGMNPEQSDALLDPYCNPEVPNDVPDRSKLINSMVIRSPRFFIFPRRAYRENRASYLRDLSLNILQTWEANWKVPTHLYDIMRHVRTSQVLISPQTLMIPAFNSFKDTWDFRWYGDLLMQAETIHDLNNIGLRFSLMDFMDEDRVIQLMENPDIPISWWADASQVSEAMNKQLGRISHSAAMPLGDLVDRFMNAHYN